MYLMKVCPYVWSDNVRHLPYEVVSLAAELLDENDNVSLVKVTASQLKYLNKLFKKAGKTFTFDKSTELVSVSTDFYLLSFKVETMGLTTFIFGIGVGPDMKFTKPTLHIKITRNSQIVDRPTQISFQVSLN